MEVPRNIDISEDLYAGVVRGVYTLGGLVKDNKGRIIKHLDTSGVDKKRTIKKALSVMSANKGATIAIGGACIIVGGVVGAILFFSHRKKKKLKRRFFECLQQYLSALQTGEISNEILDNLIKSIDALTKNGKKKNVKIQLTSEQLSLLIYTVFDYTKKVSELNNQDASKVFVPNVCSKSILNDLSNYLKIQRKTFEQAA